MKKTTFLVFLLAFLLIGTCIAAIAADKRLSDSQLTARVMFIDLENGMINVAEKEFALLSHEAEGKKVWDTRFADQEGRQIDPDQIKPGDNVQLKVRSMGHITVAMEILLLE
ncbi:MAG: hypothetical protein GX751_11965 [Desulfuromonadaceae bacterium]|nr:hypothetical protein [Desulfuromonadaceae bacterium]